MEQPEVTIPPRVEAKQELPPLPFTYMRTDDPSRAAFEVWRVSPVVVDGQPNEPKTDEAILESVRRQHEAKEWYTSEYWRKKGQPTEQIEFTVNGRQVTIYNYNKEIFFSEDHIRRTQRVLGELASRFPQVFDQTRWILIDDQQQTSIFGDPEKYPLNGYAMRECNAIRLLPRGMELIPHRVAKATNFEGTLIHEVTHLIQGEFELEWREKFQWAYCWDYKNEWEVRPTPDGSYKRFFNKQTGEMSPQNQFPLQPDQCVTYYAKQNMSEDICESMVAYVFDPKLLKTISPDKHGILEKHNANSAAPEVNVKRIPNHEIALPEVKPESVLYFVEEGPV